MSKQTLQEQCFRELMLLLEANRTSLISQSRNAGEYKNKERGKNRFERKKYSKIANAVRAYNEIDMNSLFKQDILLVNIPVVGEMTNILLLLSLKVLSAKFIKTLKIIVISLSTEQSYRH